MKGKLPSGRCWWGGARTSQGAREAHQCNIKSALCVRFPERTKGRATAGQRNQSRIPAPRLQESQRPPPLPTNQDENLETSEPLSFMWSLSSALGPDPTKLVLQLGGHIASISCSIRGGSWLLSWNMYEPKPENHPTTSEYSNCQPPKVERASFLLFWSTMEQVRINLFPFRGRLA